MATFAEPPGAVPPPAGLSDAGAVPRPRGVLEGLMVEAGELTVFCWQSLLALRGTPRYMSEVMRHAANMMKGTWFLMLGMQIFLGMSVVNFAFFFLRSIGASDFMGLVTAYAGPRQTATTMF